MKKSSNSNKKKYIVGIVIVFVIVLIILLLLLRHEKLEIEFEVDGELYQTQKLNKGDKLVDIKEPKKEGYTFDGWYLNGKEFDFNTKISEGMVLEARFTKNKYKVNIVYGNVKDDTILDIEHDSKVEEPKNPIKEDYTFLGWYVGDEKYDFNTKVTSDLTITAKWKKTKTTYTVEHFLMGLDGKYSKKADETEVLKGTIGEMVKPSVKSIKGFTSPSVKVVNKLEDGLIIKYYYERNKYSLKINGDKGILSTVGSGTYYYGDTVDVSAVVKNGYAINSWSNGLNGTHFTYKISDKSETINVSTAVKTYKLKYNLNGGVLDNKITTYTVEDDDFELGTPTKVGYTFKCWKVNGKVSNGIISKGTYGDLEVEAVFEANTDTIYTVEYYLMDLDGENYTLDDTIKLKGTTDTLVTPKVKEYTGFTSPSGIEANIDGDGTTIVKYYYKRNKYNLNISFINELDEDDKEGIKTLSKSGSYYYGKSVDVNIELLDGFDFIKWSNGDESKNITYIVTADENQTLIATIKRHSYTVTFDSDNGSEVPSSEVLFGKNIIKPVNPTRDGYDFDGWYRDETFTDEWKFDEYVMPNSDITLYAKWIIHKDTVSFNANGGKFSDGKNEHSVTNQDQGSEITKPAEPKKEGYNFNGWYKDKTFTDEWDFDSDVMPSTALTLYAKWTPITYKIHFDGNNNTSGNMNDITCTYDKDCILTNNKFVKEYTVTYDENNTVLSKSLDKQIIEYKFTGWKNGSETYIDGYTVKNLTNVDNKVITLTANWEVDETTTKLKETTRTGYDFSGWYDNDLKIDNLSNISKDLNLKAEWTPITYTIIFDGNGGKTSDGKKEVRVEAAYDKTVKALDNFINTLTLTYDFDNDEENKIESVTATFNGWKLDDKTFDASSDLLNLTTNKGDEITLIAEWTYPEVKINEEIPKKESSEKYYTYEFKDWTDGVNDYQKGQKITLDKDVTLTAEYLKVIDTDEYINEKIKTEGRADFSVSGSDKNYTININTVNSNIINNSDIEKINEILESEDVVSIELGLEETSNVLKASQTKTIITSSSELEAKIDEFLKQVTSSNTISKLYLGSLWKKKISITVNFNGELAKTNDGKTSTTYYLNYTYSGNKVINQERLFAIADSGINMVNNSNNKPYQLKRFGNKVYVTYKKGTESTAIIDIILIGGTGLNNCMTEYFKNIEVSTAKISVYSDEESAKNINIEPIGSVDKAKMANLSDLINFASDALKALGLEELGLSGVTNAITINRPMYMRIDLADNPDYIFEDGVDNIFRVEVVKPDEFENLKG